MFTNRPPGPVSGNACPLRIRLALCEILSDLSSSVPRGVGHTHTLIATLELSVLSGENRFSGNNVLSSGLELSVKCIRGTIPELEDLGLIDFGDELTPDPRSSCSSIRARQA